MKTKVLIQKKVENQVHIYTFLIKNKNERNVDIKILKVNSFMRIL